MSYHTQGWADTGSPTKLINKMVLLGFVFQRQVSELSLFTSRLFNQILIDNYPVASLIQGNHLVSVDIYSPVSPRMPVQTAHPSSD